MLHKIQTLATSDTDFQFPPDKLILPLSIRLRISVGVSSGPFAKGVFPTNMVYSSTPKLQISHASS